MSFAAAGGSAAGCPPPRRTLGACATMSCAYFAYIGLISPFAPLWYKSLEPSVFMLGVLLSLSSWTRLFAPYLWGTWADRSGDRVSLIRLACAGTFACTLFFLLPLPLWALSVAVFLMFCSNAAIMPLTEAVVAMQLTTREGGMDTRRYGRVRVWGSVGFMASVLLFGPLFERWGMGCFPWAVCGVVGLMLVLSWRLPAHRDEHTHAHEPSPPVWPVLRRPEVAWFFAGITLTVLAHAALYMFYTLYLDSLNYSKAAVGGLWAVSVVVEIAWFLLQGRWLERAALHGWLVAAALFSALRFGLTAGFAQYAWVMVLAQCLHAMTFAAQHTACVALITRYFPGRLRGRGQALYSLLGYGLSGVLGGLGGAVLSGRYGYASVFWAATAVALLGAWCCWHSLQLDRRAQRAAI